MVLDGLATHPAERTGFLNLDMQAVRSILDILVKSLQYAVSWYSTCTCRHTRRSESRARETAESTRREWIIA